MNIGSICKTKHSNLKESPVAGPRTREEPANGSRRQLTDVCAVFPSETQKGTNIWAYIQT